MPKRDLLRRIDQSSPVLNGEMVAVASITQVQHLTISGPYSGDFQIIDNGRLIVGNDPDIGARGIITPRGMFGYSAASTQTFSLWFATSPDGLNTPGDLHLGNRAANYLMYDHSEGTFGLYTPAGAGVLLDNDGSARFGHGDGANMLWDSASGSLKIRSGDVVVSEIDSNGNASFSGAIYASSGRISGDMQVDARLRAGDVDGPAVYIGKLVDEDGAAYAGQIMVTDTENVPWFNVRTGSDGTGYLHVGRPGDYPNRLTLEVTSNDAALTFDGTAYLRGGAVTGDMTVEGELTVTGGSITAGGGDVVIGDDGIRLDASTGKFTSASVEWWEAGINRLSIGTRVDLGSVVSGYVEAVDRELELTGTDVKISGPVTIADGLLVGTDNIIINTSKTPASAAATGTAGMIAWDTSYIYVCTAANTWRRATLNTW
jgi:phage baseplate assembly protein gpV